MLFYDKIKIAIRSIALSFLLLTTPIYAVTNFEEAEKYLSTQVSPENKQWFHSYLKLEIRLDPLYQEVAKQMGGVVIMGGSDVADILIGDGLKRSSEEINVLHPRAIELKQSFLKSYEEHEGENRLLPKSWGKEFEVILNRAPLDRTDQEEFNIEQEKKLRVAIVRKIFPELKARWMMGYASTNFSNVSISIPAEVSQASRAIVLNFGEMNREMDIYKANYHRGKSAANGTFGLWSALKNRYLVVVAATGEARLYFKDSYAEIDYRNKVFRFPDEGKLYVNPLVTEIKDENSQRKSLYQIDYNLALMARGLNRGWRYSEKSFTFLKYAVYVYLNAMNSSVLDREVELEISLKHILKQAGVDSLLEAMNLLEIPIKPEWTALREEIKKEVLRVHTSTPICSKVL